MPLYSSTGPIRVLQVVTIMNRAGLETMLMNYYRTIDRSKVQFDFLVHRKEAGAYDDEIRALGGKIYQLPPITLTTLSSYQDLAVAFFKQHPYYLSLIHIWTQPFSMGSSHMGKTRPFSMISTLSPPFE